MAASTAADIGKLHERVVRTRELAIRLCLRLERGDVKQCDLERCSEDPSFDPEMYDTNDFERLCEACPPYPDVADTNLWCAMSAASGHTDALLATRSSHAHVVVCCHSLLRAIRDPSLLLSRAGDDGLNKEQRASLEKCAQQELAYIANEHRRQLEAVTFAKLQAEFGAADQEIPQEYRTRMLTKKEAAKLHAGVGASNPTTYINRLIESKQITQPMGSGQKWVFDIRDFPQNAHEKLR